MTPDSMESYRMILASQEQMSRDINALNVTIARLETKLNTLCAQRGEQHSEHLGCHAEHVHRFELVEADIESLESSVARLITWGKAISVVGAILITLLTILNIALSLGVNL